MVAVFSGQRRSLQLLDLVLLAAVIGLAGFACYRISAYLHYTWNWSAIPQFLWRYDQIQHRWVANYLLEGLLTTIRLSCWSGVLALILGLLLALLRTGRSLYGYLLARSFIELMRNLPPLVIIFLVYFFLADQLLPLIGFDTQILHSPIWQSDAVRLLLAPPGQLEPFVSAVITLAIFESAYVAEIIRAGVASVEQSQWDAAHALGLTRTQCLRHVILPQAFRRIMPPLAGQMISLIKDSAIVSVISIQELTYQATQLMASTFLTIEVWLTVAALYFVLTWPCALAVNALDRRLNRRM